jgi:hypothetical protein
MRGLERRVRARAVRWHQRVAEERIVFGVRVGHALEGVESATGLAERGGSTMKQGRPPPSFVVAVLVVCACIAAPLRQTPKGVAPAVAPGSDLGRAMIRQLDTAYQQLLSHGTCSAGQLGWCGDGSPWIWLGTGDGFRWSTEYFNERGERVGSESGGCAGRWHESGFLPTCRETEGQVVREFCSEALRGFERTRVSFVSRCLGNGFERRLPIGRSVVEVLAGDGALSLEVEVPRSTHEEVSIRVAVVADDLRLFELENQNPFHPRHAGDRIGREVFVTPEGGLTDVRSMIGQGRLCSFDTHSFLQPLEADAGVPKHSAPIAND